MSTLPDLISSKETNSITFNFPNVLQDVKVSGASDVFTVMNGGRHQVVMTTDTFESETEVTPPPIFKILATNRILFGGAVINVLNDAEIYNEKQLAPSNPTASAYMAQRGQQVFTYFSCDPVDSDSAVFKSRKRSTLFVVRQSSFVLP